MKRIMYIAAILVIVFIIAITGSRKGDENSEEIIIGAALSLSGDAAQDGENIKNGLELARADLAQNDVDVKVVYQDDKTEPKNTVSAINALAVQGVDAIIGPTWSYLADAGVPVADSLGLVTVMPANTSEYVNTKSPNAFYTTIRVENMTRVLAQWLKDSSKKKIAIVRNPGAWYETVGKAVERAAADSGTEIVYSEVIPFGTDASTIATSLAKVKAVKADILFFEVDDYGNIAAILKKVEEQKIPVTLMSVTTALGKVSESIKISNDVFVLAPKTSDEFDAKYRAAYGVAAGAYADSAYDSLMLLVDAIDKKGDMSLASYLRDKTRYEGFAKIYDFDQNGDIVGGEWTVKKL